MIRWLARAGLITLALTLGLVFFSPAAAEEEEEQKKRPVALAGKLSTLGLAVELIMPLTEEFNLRIGLNAATFDVQGWGEDLGYNLDARWLSTQAVLDWHPLPERGLRVSGGLIVNGNHLEVEAETKSGRSYTLGAHTYTAEQLGYIDGGVDFNAVCPYLGLGWGDGIGSQRRWSFLFEAGIVFQGVPRASLDSTNPENLDDLAADLAQEEERLEDNLGWLQFFPLISIGVSYRF